jgi:hypothetical protein
MSAAVLRLFSCTWYPSRPHPTFPHRDEPHMKTGKMEIE